MFFLPLRGLLARPRPLVATVLLVAIVLGLVPVATAMLWQANEQVQADITDFARGHYDLLVRPLNAPSSVETTLGIVEENYLGVGDGGITIETWREIADDERIEFAAPAAALGYFTKIDHTFQLPEPDGPTRYRVVHETTDGQATYLAADPQTAYFLFPYSGTSYDSFYPIELMNIFNMGRGNPNFQIPSTYHPVLAIDPEAEAALTGVDFSSLSSDVNDPSLWPHEAQYIPLVDVADSPTPIKTSITMETLDVTQEEIATLKAEVGLSPNDPLDDIIFLDNEEGRAHVEAYLDSLTTVSEETHTIDFSKHLSPFESDWYALNNQYELVMEEDYDVAEYGSVSRASGYLTQNTFYKVAPPAYEWNQDNGLSVSLIDWNGDIPVHRNVEAVEHQVYDLDGDNSDLVYLHQMNTVTIGELQEKLAASPLGIYQFHYGIHEETGAELSPTHLPGNYLPTPAHGLISIEWAERFKGEAPIDAIRVKVAGIDGYTEEAAELIRTIAADIAAKGLHVDIIAGASHQTISVDVEEIGTVSQPWTTLGAADTILDSWNVFAAGTGGTFLIVAVLSLAARLRVMEAEQADERKRLALIGWQAVTIRRFYRTQWLMQLAAGVGLSAISLLLVFGFQPVLFIGYGIALLAIVLLKALVGSFYGRFQKDGSFRAGQSLIVTNIRYYVAHIAAAALQLLLTTGLLAFIVTVSGVTSERMTQTNLGTYVHWQLSEQQTWLIAGVAVLTVFTLIESLFRLWHARRHHMRLLVDVGWHNRHIRRIFRRETLAWSGLAIVVGMVGGWLLVMATAPFTPAMLLNSAGITLAIVVFVTIVTELTVARSLNTVQKG